MKKLGKYWNKSGGNTTGNKNIKKKIWQKEGGVVSIKSV